MKQLRKANLDTLTQIEELVRSLQNENCVGSSLYADSGVGPHIRHVLDHYLTFMEGFELGHVDYNVRNRNSDIETDSVITLKLINDIKRWIEFSDKLFQKPLTIISEISSTTVENASIDSNVERELHYLAYHGIHHAAYCSLLATQAGITIDASVGLAPGTASYLRSVRT